MDFRVLRRRAALAGALALGLCLAPVADASTGKIRGVVGTVLEELGITTGGVYAGGVSWPLTAEGDLDMDDGAYQIFLDGGSATNPALFFGAGEGFYQAAVNTVSVTAQNAEKVRWGATGSTFYDSILVDTDSAYDLGATGERWQTLFVDSITCGGTATVANCQPTTRWLGGDNIYFGLGNAVDVAFDWSSAQATAHNAVMAINASGTSAGGGALILTEAANANKDHHHAVSSDPSLIIHSKTDVDADSDEFLRFYHDGTNPYIEWNSGSLIFNPLGGQALQLPNTTYATNVEVSALSLDDDNRIVFGTGNDAILYWSGSVQATAHQLMLAIPADGTANKGGSLVMTEYANRNKDHHLAVSSEVRLVLFDGGTDVDSDATNYLELYHDGTDAVLNTGATNAVIRFDYQGAAGGAYLEADRFIAGTVVKLDGDNVDVAWNTDAYMRWSSNQATAQNLMLAIDADGTSAAGGALIITEGANLSKDHHLAVSSSPSYVVFSSTDVDSDATEFGRIWHDTAGLNIDTGAAADEINLRPGGSFDALAVNNTAATFGVNVLAGGAITFTGNHNLTMGSGGQILADAGTAAAPGISISGDPDTGFYGVSGNRVGWATGGAVRVDVQNTAMTMYVPLNFNGSDDLNMGSGGQAILDTGANALLFGSAGNAGVEKFATNVTRVTDGSTGFGALMQEQTGYASASSSGSKGGGTLEGWVTGNGAGTGSLATGYSAAGIGSKHSTGTTSADRVYGWSTINTRFDTLPIAVFKFSCSETADVRAVIGLSNDASGNSWSNADDPAGIHVGLSFSTNASQTTWQFQIDDGTTQTLTDTSHTVVDDEVLYLVIDCTSTSSITLTLLDEDGAQLATTTATTNLPASTTAFGAQYQISTLTTAAKALTFYWARVALRP